MVAATVATFLSPACAWLNGHQQPPHLMWRLPATSTETKSDLGSSADNGAALTSLSRRGIGSKVDPATWFDTMGKRAGPLVAETLTSSRAEGSAALTKVPMPSRKVEAWRQTNTNLLFGDDAFAAAPAVQAEFLATKEDLADLYMEDAAGAQLVFVDGIFVPELSDTSKLRGSGYFDATVAATTAAASIDTAAAAAAAASDTAAAVMPSFPAAPSGAASGSYVGPLSQMPTAFPGVEEVKSQLSYLPEISQGVESPREADGSYGPPVRLPNQPPQGVTDARTGQGSGCFAALNQACVSDAAVIYIDNRAANDATPAPLVQVIFASTGNLGGAPAKTISHPRLVVIAKQGARLNFTQSFCDLGGQGSDGGGYFTNGLARVVVEDGARVDHCYVQEESQESFHFDSLSVSIGADASHELLMACTGGYLSRVNYDATLVGEGGLAQIHTVMLASGKQSMDIHSSITHACPAALSRQQQRNIVSDQGEAIFRGRIRVEQAAQDTDSEQLCRSLLLSDNARVSKLSAFVLPDAIFIFSARTLKPLYLSLCTQVTAMPSMEIIADQVSCAHGATVADLSPEELFYLQSRGLTKEVARAMLIKATVFEFSSRIPCSKVKARIAKKIDDVVPKMKERTDFDGYSSI